MFSKRPYDFLYCIYIIDTSEGELHPAGEVIYPFQFQLPPNLPCSFEGGDDSIRCSIRYYIECRIDRLWNFDIKVQLPFTVISVLDLNQYPGARVRCVFFH